MSDLLRLVFISAFYNFFYVLNYFGNITVTWKDHKTFSYQHQLTSLIELLSKTIFIIISSQLLSCRELGCQNNN